MKDKSFYRAFEDRFRGSSELIKSRLRIYLPFVIPLKAIYDDCRVIDLGCGRGEWLELIANEGFEARGVDLDESMLAISNAAGFSVVKSDIIEYLKKIQDKSVVVVSGLHIIEHISLESLQTLVTEAFRVLKPGGLLILETPNPENLLVSTTNFYLDPTHNKPIPPNLLYFLAEYNGFARIKILRMQESPSISSSDDIGLADLFVGVSPDYAAVAQKRAPDEQMSLFDQAFDRGYGVSFDDLALLYAKKEQQFVAYEHDRWQWLESEWNSAKARIDVQAGEVSALRDRNSQLGDQLESERKKSHWLDNEWNAAKARIDMQAGELRSIHSSRCWQITASLRAIHDLLLRAKANISAIPRIFSQKRGSIANSLLTKSINFAIDHPRLKSRVLVLVHRFPRLDSWLCKMLEPIPSQQPLTCSDLSPHVCRVYADLMASIERNRRCN